MKTINKIYLSLIVFLMSPIIKAQDLTISDYCGISQSMPKGIKDMVPMPGGENYAVVNKEGTVIELFSYATGKKTGELFNVESVKGELKIPNFDGFQMSDNGKKILLWNEKENIYRYSFTAQYYVYDTFRSTLQKVSDKGPQRGAVISHDGRYVAYTRDNNIFISNLDYKTDYQITEDGLKNKIINGVPDWSYEEEFGVLNTIKWSSDDSLLAFMKFNETDVPEYVFDQYKSYCDSDWLSDLYPLSYSYKYPLAGFSNALVSVHSYNLDTKVTKTMDLPIAATDYVPLISFDGEGKNLMIMILNHEQNNLNLYKVNPASTVATPILNEKSDTWLSPSSYQMIKFAKQDFVIGSERSGTRHLYQYDYNGNLKRQLTKGDFNVTAYYGSSNAGLHYFQSTSSGVINRDVAYVDNTGVLKLLHSGEGTYNAYFNGEKTYYVLSYSSSVCPPQYFLYNNKGKKLLDIELNQEYADKYKNAPKMEFLKVKNDSGEDMNAFIIKPTDFTSSKKYPLVMYQYNGPESQEVLNRWRMEGIFYLASQGYIVACVDGRGTGNRDTAWSRCVYKRLGELETMDQIAGARYFSNLPYIDSSRTACFGWSYGGYMTMMEMGYPSSPFKAGVSMAGVSDWRFYDSPYTERFMQTPSQNPEGYKKSSALNYTGNVKGRILLISGTDDDNVHMYNTLKYSSKLSAEGQIVDMMIYPGFEHSLRMCDARVQLFRKINDFLNFQLR